jgi:hypothetical protein
MKKLFHEQGCFIFGIPIYIAFFYWIMSPGLMEVFNSPDSMLLDKTSLILFILIHFLSLTYVLFSTKYNLPMSIFYINKYSLLGCMGTIGLIAWSLFCFYIYIMTGSHGIKAIIAYFFFLFLWGLPLGILIDKDSLSG